MFIIFLFLPFFYFHFFYLQKPVCTSAISNLILHVRTFEVKIQKHFAVLLLKNLIKSKQNFENEFICKPPLTWQYHIRYRFLPVYQSLRYRFELKRIANSVFNMQDLISKF